MDEMKLKLNAAVAEKLGAAPASAEKDELIEELSDNLYRRFLDMTGAGVPEEEAFNRALEDLGDVDELLAYLGTEPGRQGADAAREEAGTTREGRADEHGDVHYDYHTEVPQSDLDAIFANVSEVCRIAVDQAKEAVRQAKDAIQRRTTVQRDNGHVKVHFNTHPDGFTPPAPPEPAEPSEPTAPPEPPEPPTPPAGWEFEAELDSDEGRFFAGAGPKRQRDIIYGFGYDKAKGGFFAQWGEYKGEEYEAKGPHFCGEGSTMSGNEDGSYSVTALKDLRGIEVYTTSGDVTIHVSEAPDAGVIIDGDVDELDVTCSADGVLTIREGRTASSSFFSRRGFCSADVELFIPRRHWEMISVTTASGDVEIDRDALDIDTVTVNTASGDLCCRLRACQALSFKSASGDLDLQGTCTSLHATTMSGDITLRGQMEEAVLKTASGDIELEGLVSRFHGDTMSGDVRVETSQLPEAMAMSSKSGDCEARIPDAGPFSLRMKTVSGEMDCEFHMNYINGMFVHGDGTGPAYSMTSISGDVTLTRY